MNGTKEDVIKYRLDRSLETFEEAKCLATAGKWNGCVNRLYYSSFYLLTALLLKNSIKAETHKGVKTQFHLHFVKTGIVSMSDGKFFSELFTLRQEEDYEDLINFDEKTVLPLMKEVEDFNKKIIELL
jgi:uncharacterized protein (UPF0332 family)